MKETQTERKNGLTEIEKQSYKTLKEIISTAKEAKINLHPYFEHTIEAVEKDLYKLRWSIGQRVIEEYLEQKIEVI